MTEPSGPMFFLMPEWQGSAAARAMLIADGAESIRGDLPSRSRVDVPVPSQAGDALGTPIARLSSVLSARDAARKLLREHGVPAITLGGDCASTLAGIERAVERDPSVALLWFDAHPDLQHPATSPSGAASGMTLRHVLGDGDPDLSSAYPIDPSRVLLIGTREVDPEEAALISELGLRTVEAPVDGDANALAEPITQWLLEVGASSVYVHIDLDVLDPAEFVSVHVPVPFGLTVAQLTAAVRAAVTTRELAGAALCEFAPADLTSASDDAPTVLRLLGALTAGQRQ